MWHIQNSWSFGPVPPRDSCRLWRPNARFSHVALGIVKSREICLKGDQITGGHNLSCVRKDRGLLPCMTRNPDYLVPQCISSAFHSLRLVVGTWWIFTWSTKATMIQWTEEFLKTSLETPSSPLPSHSIIFSSKNRKASTVKCFLFSAFWVRQEGPWCNHGPFLFECSMCSNQNKVQSIPSGDTHRTSHEPDGYVGPHGAQRHTPRAWDNFASSLLELCRGSFKCCAPAAQKSLIESGEFREGFLGHMSYELGPGGWLSFWQADKWVFHEEG